MPPPLITLLDIDGCLLEVNGELNACLLKRLQSMKATAEKKGQAFKAVLFTQREMGLVERQISGQARTFLSLRLRCLHSVKSIDILTSFMTNGVTPCKQSN